MRRRTEQTFFQRSAGGQHAREKMLNIANHQGNGNQSYNEISSHTGQNGHHQKNLETINAGEGIKKSEPSCTVGGNVN